MARANSGAEISSFFQYAIISHNLVDLPLTMGQFIDDDDLFDDNEVAMLGVTVDVRVRACDSRVFCAL